MEGMKRRSLGTAASEQGHDGVVAVLDGLDKRGGALFVLRIGVRPGAQQRQRNVPVPVHGRQDERGAPLIVAAVRRMALILEHLHNMIYDIGRELRHS